MLLLRKLLFPFALIYWVVTAVRNFFYDKRIFHSASYNIPVIAVGNLNVGGTGKTPQIEYLIRLLSKDQKVAVLSRGYKRKSKGFILADDTATAETIGDEPFQYFEKFTDVVVAVDSNRRNGIEKLMQLGVDVILLDDAFQHRKVKAGFYVLLTAYNDLYSDDYLLPMGNLREASSGSKRADVVIVTKCPQELSESEQVTTIRKLKIASHQQIYFSKVAYDDKVLSNDGHLTVSDIKKVPKLLVAGIAKPKPFFDFLKSNDDQVLEFPDHHDFSSGDISAILKKAEGRLIITTEKDYVRLKGKLPSSQLYYLAIRSRILDSENFNKTILNYVGKS
ncbi:MAG: tetraacyldisaccharide 4'-kinase [Flavobacterium sp.]|nr:tetraacyldisaccharide 4'-kinase [Flavobacterium sp.]